MKTTAQFLSKSPEETKTIGRLVARGLRKGDVVLFLANLGSGKTTLVQGLVRQLGVPSAALSPTFVLAQTLQGRMPIHHLDFYRLQARAVLDLGIEDYLLGQGEIEKGVVLIEWADRCKAVWPSDRLEIHIRPLKKMNSRKITLVGYGAHFQSVVNKVRSKYEK